MQRKSGHFGIGLCVAGALSRSTRSNGKLVDTGTRIPLAAGRVSIRSMPR
jgi:hypothetical protein